MSLLVVNSLDEKFWREFVERHPQGNIFHTPEMFRVFERPRGHRPLLRAAMGEDGQVLALLLPVQVTLMNGFLRRLTTRSIVYGGVLCSTDQAGKVALASLLQSYSENVGREALLTEMRNLSDLSVIQSTLAQCGFLYEDHLDYLIDLNGSPGNILQRIGCPHAQAHSPRVAQGKCDCRRDRRRETFCQLGTSWCASHIWLPACPWLISLYSKLPLTSCSRGGWLNFGWRASIPPM